MFAAWMAATTRGEFEISDFRLLIYWQIDSSINLQSQI